MSFDEIYAVIGAGGCGRSAMPIARAEVSKLNISNDCLFFVDDDESSKEINGQKVMSFNSFSSLPSIERKAVITVADPKVRHAISQRCLSNNITPWSIRSDNSIIMDDVVIGDGSVLCPFVTLTSNITIGACFHANLYSYVEHDCSIGDFVTFAPGVKCNGNVTIGNMVYIGAGAVIHQGSNDVPLYIGDGATIGMGAVVLNDVLAGQTVVGNPARPINKKR